MRLIFLFTGFLLLHCSAKSSDRYMPKRRKICHYSALGEDVDFGYTAVTLVISEKGKMIHFRFFCCKQACAVRLQKEKENN